jgi:protein-S-isoprenylcysteine O-methyltransferase Ste14
VPLGWALLAAFAVWNGWSLWLFARHETGLLPGGATMSLIEEGPYRLSRNPLYVGLLALHLAIALLVPSFWAVVALPVSWLLVWWGAVRPEEPDVVALPVSWLLVWWGAVRPEERFLRDRFGEEYDAYARRVRRWL